jgi:uncharacterized membrane protein
LRLLVDLNGFLHDFTSALFFCGSILLWFLLRESRRDGVLPETRQALSRLARKLWSVTLPSLIVALATGGVRAATFAEYEYAGEITGTIVTALVVKHIVFTAFVAWGIWVHWKMRKSPPFARDSVGTPASG